MAKLTKSALKSIVKECLVEILQDGLLTTQEVINESKGRQPNKSSTQAKASLRRVGLDNIKFSKSTPNKDLKKNIQETARSMTSDPVLSSILADTAMTTLQDQFQATDKGSPAAGSDAATLQASRSNPQDLFGESASKWADLAFSPSSRDVLKP
ncbi:MAG: hypothetical protein CMB80_10770 [Flammeovirgaceae bacterium]|nr:hypothetical protein [Flammeovirgaceae bacterium]